MTDKVIKSLEWLILNFPKTIPAQDNTDRLSNCINLYCQNAVDELNRQKAEIEEKSNKLREVLPIVAELKAEKHRHYRKRNERKAVMREILFRGKRQDNGEWICGNLTVWSDGSASIDKEPTEGSPLYAVVEETVGQGSTVVDKNGVEMYEGDIVYGAAHWLERFKTAVVAFQNGSFGLTWHRGDIEVFNPFASLCNVEYEVVGNIFDNPELLKGE